VEAALAEVKARMAATGWKHWDEASIRAGVEAKKQAALSAKAAESAAAAAAVAATAAAAPLSTRGVPELPSVGGVSFASVVERMRRAEKESAEAERKANGGMF
jgi:hypothetical protein